MPSKSTSKKTSKKETVGSIGYLKNGLLKQGCVVVFKSDEKKPEEFLEKMKKVYGQSVTAHASSTADYDDKFTELKEKMSSMEANVEDHEYPEDNYFLASGTTSNALDEAVRELTGGKMTRLGDKKSKDKKDDDSDNEEEEKKGKKDSKKDTKKKSKKDESDDEESEKEESGDEKPKKGKKESKKEAKKDSKKDKKDESDAEPSDNEKNESGSEAESEDDKPKKTAKKSSSKAKGK